MIFLATILQFIGGYFEILYLKIIANKKNQENLYSSISSILVALISFTFFLIFSDNRSDQISIMLSDYRIYLSMLLEFGAFYLFRLNYQENHQNLTAVKIGIFSSVFLVPMVAYFFTDLFGYATTIVVNYDSGIEAIALITITAILYTALFRIRNKHNPIPNPQLLILLCLLAPITMYFAVKNIQLFDGYLFFTLIGFMNFIVFFTMSIIKNEDRHINDLKNESIAKIFFALVFVYATAPIIAKVLSVEFLTIIKRVFAIFIGVGIDKADRQCRWRDVISISEISILIALILIGAFLQLKT